MNVRPGLNINIVVNVDHMRETIDVGNSIIHEVTEGVLIVAQTDPPISRTRLGQDFDVRQYIFDVKPLLTGEQSLGDTMRRQATEFSTVAEIPVAVDVRGDGGSRAPSTRPWSPRDSTGSPAACSAPCAWRRPSSCLRSVE